MNKKSHIDRILQKAEEAEKRGDKKKAQYWLDKAEKFEQFINKQKGG